MARIPQEPPAFLTDKIGQKIDHNGATIGQMFASLLLFAALSQSTVNYTDIFVGNWNISVVELDEDGREREERSVYSVRVGNIEALGKVGGQVIGEDEEGVPVPVGKIEFEQDPESNGTFVFSLADNAETDDTEPVTTFTLEMGVDDVCVTTGKTNDGVLYSLNVLSMYVIEVTLYNKENKAITIVRCLKEQPTHQTSIWSMLLPMLPSLMMMFMGGGNMGQCQACQTGPAGEQAAGDKKND